MRRVLRYGGRILRILSLPKLPLSASVAQGPSRAFAVPLSVLPVRFPLHDLRALAAKGDVATVAGRADRDFQSAASAAVVPRTEGILHGMAK